MLNKFKKIKLKVITMLIVAHLLQQIIINVYKVCAGPGGNILSFMCR